MRILRGVLFAALVCGGTILCAIVISAWTIWCISIHPFWLALVLSPGSLLILILSIPAFMWGFNYKK